MVMRVGGLATGMDIESMVNKLMEAERIPLVKMEQDRTELEWKRDAFRDVNKNLLELRELLRDMKYSQTYQTKTVTSSQESAVTATGSTSATNGSYNIKVDQLATNAMRVSEKGIDIDKEFDSDEIIKFTTFTEEGKAEVHEVEVKAGDTIKDAIKGINDLDSPVRAFYDENSKQVVMETTRTGKYNENGNEIIFGEADDKGNVIDSNSDSFFTETLKMKVDEEKGGENAKFTYNNGLELESKDNSYSLNGITFNFHNTTESAATLTVANDVENSFDAITKFVETYNKVVETINQTQTEESFRDFKPLTNEQKKEMSEDEIKKWEEKAKSGLLRRESSLTNGAYSMRSAMSSIVGTGGEFTALTQIGISTTVNYMDGGKLQIDEDKLREALQNNPDDVQKLFSNSSKDGSEGIVNRLESAVKDTMGKIEEQAGKSTHTLDNYTLGKRMKELNERINLFELKMQKVETRHWNQFTQMEKAIQRLNDQSAQLFSQFG